MSDLDDVIAGVSCRSLLGSLVEFVEDDLTAHERKRVEDHLTHCPRCEKFGREYQALVATLRGKASEGERDVESMERLRTQLEQRVWSSIARLGLGRDGS